MKLRKKKQKKTGMKPVFYPNKDMETSPHQTL